MKCAICGKDVQQLPCHAVDALDVVLRPGIHKERCERFGTHPVTNEYWDYNGWYERTLPVLLLLEYGAVF